jgi:hypothetical protein
MAVMVESMRAPRPKKRPPRTKDMSRQCRLKYNMCRLPAQIRSYEHLRIWEGRQ